MKNKKVNLKDVPLKQRHLVAISPGFFFADDTEMKWPKESWEDVKTLAKELEKKDAGYVAFRRFIYDPEEGQVFLDKGWVYFGGEVYDGKDVVDGKVNLPVSDIAVRNIENNNFKTVIWFPGAGKMYPLNKEDKFVDLKSGFSPKDYYENLLNDPIVQKNFKERHGYALKGKKKKEVKNGK